MKLTFHVAYDWKKMAGSESVYVFPVKKSNARLEK